MLPSRQLDYQANNGSWQTLRPMSILNSYELFATYAQLLSVLEKLPKNEPIWQHYLNNPLVAKHCNKCLQLAGIEPRLCSAEMLITFLFPHETYEGEMAEQGVIFSFNFPPSKKQKKEAEQKANAAEDIAKVVSAIWIATENLEQSLKLVESLSLDELEQLLKLKHNMLKPKEERDREAGFEDAMQILKEKGLVG